MELSHKQHCSKSINTGKCAKPLLPISLPSPIKPPQGNKPIPYHLMLTAFKKLEVLLFIFASFVCMPLRAETQESNCLSLNLGSALDLLLPGAFT